MRPLDECVYSGIALGRDDDGRLYIKSDDQWELFDFNSIYSGYYPPCRFTALAACGGFFHAAGTDDNGRPHLFSSMSGSAWEERPLATRDPMGDLITVNGNVIGIIGHEEQRQLFLVTDAGQLVTLPECPKCMRVHALGGRPAGARLCGSDIIVDMEDGTRTLLSVNALTQYRVSWTYAAGLFAKGAVIADLREKDNFALGNIPNSVNVPFSALSDWLTARDKAEVILFLCRTGTLADEAADFARAGGWLNAYSMGGLNAFGHVE